jgi:hypothetical protein
MRRHHTGSGRRQVIPNDWASHHETVVLGTLRGLVDLREPGTLQTWNPATEQNDVTPKAAYATDVPARVLALSGQARILQLADDTEVIADYLVVIPAEHVVAGGHLIDVTDSEDPALNGRTLRVEKAAMGTERFERDLFCTLDD